MEGDRRGAKGKNYMELEAFKNQVESMVTADLETAESNHLSQQATLCHYTDVKGALGILQSGKLWFTERAHVNDTVEMSYGLSVAQKLFAKSRSEPIPEIMVSHLRETHEMRLNKNGYWTFSASLNSDHLGQWQRYADDGRGVCLGFSVQKLTPMLDVVEVKKLMPHVHQARHFRMSYCVSRLEASMQPYIASALEVLKTFDLPPKNHATLQDEQATFFYLNGGLYLHSMLYKHKAYEQEEEYRFLISGQRDNFADYDCHCVRERNRQIVGYLTLPIPEWRSRKIQSGVLTHVRIGPAAPDQLRDQIWIALKSLGIPMFGIDIDKSNIPYRPS
jgi:hypothetical protein